MYQNKNFRSLSTTLITARNHQLTLITVKAKFGTGARHRHADAHSMQKRALHRLQKPQYIKMLIYIGCVSKDAIFVQFYVILPDIPLFIHLTLRLNVIRNNW